MFDRSLVRHAPGLQVAVENEAHRPFLDALFIACSPMRGVLPDPMMQQQAALRETAYRTDHPVAMRRVVVAKGAPIGRIIVDWGFDGAALLVDIAVAPERQGAGMGTALLHAYLDVADRRGQPAMLHVMRDNPALRLYARLGFAPVEPQDFAPHLAMIRAPHTGG
ncbi:MAG: N-acetyltransferase [Sphingomonas sp.]|uniref:GNAT family N-acetyltransferase n=1 Tax=Sphingomonas sp. TaxID=28214 RepID=UPI0011FAC19B|nr:GNAT family N-acetyltransferase [Sphingomonas sp.]THD34762.1 MAG: N-acetyltransferase [Sphingomonas sp.]